MSLHSAYLTISEHQISSLPDQSDIPFWNKEWIAPQLKELLFGQSETELKQRTYFIVDATLRKKITKIFDLDSSLIDIPIQCLFKGDAAEQLKEAAPYLIDMTLPDGAYDDKDKVPSFHKKFFEEDWQQNTGIFIRTNALMNEAWRHFRSFTKVQTSAGKTVFFRFWVPTTFYPFACFYKNSEDYAHLLFHNVTQKILFRHPQKPKFLSCEPHGPLLPRKKFIIDDALKAHFTSYVHFTQAMKLWHEAEELLINNEPELAEKIKQISRAKRFCIAKKLYRLRITDTVQSAAIMSIIHSTGIDILSEPAFDYSTKNPFLLPNAKARQLTLSFVEVARLAKEGEK